MAQDNQSISGKQDNRLGNKITTLREAHHLSVQDLADRCGFDVDTIERLEAGDVPPSLAPLIKLTRALGVRWAPSWMMTNRSDPPTSALSRWRMWSACAPCKQRKTRAT